MLRNRRPAHRAAGRGSPAGGAGLVFDRIYEERFDDVERWVRALGARPSDVADLVQEVFVVVHRRLAAFEGENVAGWLYQITRRKMRDYRRLSWIQHLFTPKTLSKIRHAPAPAADPLKQLEDHRRVQLLESLLGALPAEQRAAFVLFEMEGYSGAAIAELQQVTINTVWGRIHNARQKLQGRLLALEGDAARRR